MQICPIDDDAVLQCDEGAGQEILLQRAAVSGRGCVLLREQRCHLLQALVADQSWSGVQVAGPVKGLHVN